MTTSASAGWFCRLIERLHRRCAGRRIEPEMPPALRAASHRLLDEVQALQGQAFKVRQTCDELTDLVEHMQRDRNAAGGLEGHA